MTHPCDLSLSDLRVALDQRDLSSKELTESYLERAEKYRDLNCYLELNREAALQAAEQADGLLRQKLSGPLLGIPIAVKDIILTKGVKTTAGSRILENFVPPYDATVTKKLREAGAIVLGKTNLDEFAMGSSNENSAFGAVKNPWDPTRVAGGSSGGSAAAVSARLAPAALGTDTGGSIRQPASFCGVVGLKPTYGRVSRYGVVAFASSLDQVGAFANSVDDCALMTQILSGHDPLDATSMEVEVPDLQAELNGSVKGLRIGVPKEYFVDGVEPAVRDAIQKSLSTFEELGAELVEISLPHTDAAVSTYYIIAPAEASSNLGRYDGIRYGHRAADVESLNELYARSRSEGFGPEVKRRILIGTYVLSKGYFDAYYVRAQKVRTLIANDFKTAFESSCDVIASPTAPTTAFPIGAKTDDPVAMYLNDIFTIPASLAGLPGLSVPCGQDSDGLPIGLQLLGRPWEEGTLLRAAKAFESATDWHSLRAALN